MPNKPKRHTFYDFHELQRYYAADFGPQFMALILWARDRFAIHQDTLVSIDLSDQLSAGMAPEPVLELFKQMRSDLGKNINIKFWW